MTTLIEHQFDQLQAHTAQQICSQDHSAIPLKLEVSTWQRDSHGLYDYESGSGNQSSYSTQLLLSVGDSGYSMGQFICVRDSKDQKVALLPLTETPLPEQEVLFKVGCKLGNYYLFHKDSLLNKSFSDSQQMVWLPIKDLLSQKEDSSDQQVIKSHLGSSLADTASKGYVLKQGDVIKFGRICYKVAKVHVP